MKGRFLVAFRLAIPQKGAWPAVLLRGVTEHSPTVTQ